MITISDLQTVLSNIEARSTMQMIRKRVPVKVKMVKSERNDRLVFKSFVKKSDVAIAFENTLSDSRRNCVKHRVKWFEIFNKIKDIL